LYAQSRNSLQPPAEEQFRRVGGIGAASNDIEFGNFAVLDHILRRRFPQQISARPLSFSKPKYL